MVAMVANFGLLAFRDPHGIRPLVIGKAETERGVEYIVASESVALDVLGFKLVRDVEPGEAVFIDMDGNFYSRQCAEHPELTPCIFEYVYLARPDSLIDYDSGFGIDAEEWAHRIHKRVCKYEL